MPPKIDNADNEFAKQIKKLKNKRAFAKKQFQILEKLLSEPVQEPAYNEQIIKQLDSCESHVQAFSMFLEEIYDEDFEADLDEFISDVSDLNSTFAINKLKINDIVLPKEIQKTTSRADGLWGVKLPTISLPTFTGKKEEWLSFKQTFDSLIHSKDCLSEIDKLQYLIASLRNEAAEVVKSLEIKEGNYTHALELLRERYENKRATVNKHLTSIFEMQKIIRETHFAMRHLLDTVAQNYRALASLDRPVEYWDDILIFLILSKLPYSARREWENKQSSELPTFESLKMFLIHRCQLLEAMNDKGTNEFRDDRYKPRTALCNAAEVRYIKCFVCERDHFTNLCPDLKRMSLKEKNEVINTKRLCRNCLRKGHLAKDCRSSKCRLCRGLHNTILHSGNPITDFRQSDEEQTVNALHTRPVATCETVLLSTCIVSVEDSDGIYHNARILLDTGSQINLITRQFANQLRLPETSVQLSIGGIGGEQTRSYSKIEVEIKSKTNDFRTNADMYIMDRITSAVPFKSFDSSQIAIPQECRLADPEYYKSREIDCLIGAQLFYNILRTGFRRTCHGNIILQNTAFGWLISGSANLTSRHVSCHLTRLETSISKFWETEHVNEIKAQSEEESQCETHFMQTHARNERGRFIVALPWKESPAILGNSFDYARKCFVSLESRLVKNPEARNEYNSFIKEYIELGHMAPIGLVDGLNQTGYFMPHHAVYKLGSVTTKVRVVFNASAKPNNGKSLNDILMRGPVLQDDLFSILLRFRCHEYVLTADIAKMYRQILVVDQDTEFQKILFRFSPDEPITIYSLKTLTYGTKPASYIATRCLKVLADSMQKINPEIGRIINSDFYMDDLLTGSDDINQLQLIQSELSNVLSGAGFELRKWASNEPRVLEGLKSFNEKTKNLIFDEDDTLKTLGISWSIARDTIEYKASILDDRKPFSKRSVLSCISRLFDPLGLLGPGIMLAKLLMQDLWKLKIGWDEPLPSHLVNEWKALVKDFTDISCISIPRKMTSKHANYEIFGFADASEKGYGACVYLRSQNSHDVLACHLMCAKSRVAPIKTITLPRLELCAALLLVELVERVTKALNLNISRKRYYSDSTVVLNWIKSCPSRWKVFVAHRVTEIQNKTKKSDWHHVMSNENPADILSRGALPKSLIGDTLWWHGPRWLMERNLLLEPLEKFETVIDMPEQKIVLITEILEDSFGNNFIAKFSSFEKLLRVVSYVHRFVYNCRASEIRNKRNGCLLVSELRESERFIIKTVQHIYFSKDIAALRRSERLDSQSSLLSLNPFIDNDGILHVGGRLRNAEIPYVMCHPILLPKGNHFVDLLIRHVHMTNLHAGIQGTLCALRVKYWIIAGKSAVRNIVRKCIVCFKNLPRPTEPIMGDLPRSRVQMSRPFLHVGLDYFGPFSVKFEIKSRKLYKSYGAVFICMSTKAVHCELVESLTTESFLNAFKRFISRRGLPSDLYSDNGTNFVGAAREIKEIQSFLCQDSHIQQCREEFLKNRICWHFSPPRAPHFGGLWEAAVKSFKRHVYKVANSANLTFLELSTLLIEIESILNSRPLTALSSDPNDLQFLTPGHFLIGDHMRALPELDLTNERVNTLNRWQRVQQLHQHFWKLWKRDYLLELQRRHKWKRSVGPSIEVGELVIIKEDNTPSKCWKMGRVVKVHPGKDGVVRTASVRTADAEFLRPTTRLFVLPVKD